ncbi:hypothetical protein [Longirhabdus pacifica]|uniref:hypothetical protein n=1 Tax=Longirhabdus pacifica TaxID=2305227 RepID=UPI001008C3F6|nr:hypothetical protein [Longirhabdus pacifica]
MAIKVKKKVVCNTNETNLLSSVDANKEITLYESILGVGRSGMISIDNMTGNSLSVVFVKEGEEEAGGDEITAGVTTFAFEHVHSIKVINNSDQQAMISYEISILLDYKVKCMISNARIEKNLNGSEQSIVYESLEGSQRQGILSISQLRFPPIEVIFMTSEGAVKKTVEGTGKTFSFEQTDTILLGNNGSTNNVLHYAICLTC